jgi:hypothetical protein
MTHRYACKTFASLDGRTKEAWLRLWEAAGGHFFNSPAFFEAWLKAFEDESCLIVCGYRDGELRAVLPLVRDRVFGVPALAGPGRRGNYLDKAVLLVGENDLGLLDAVVAEALRYGHLYLAEADEGMAAGLEVLGFPRARTFASRSLWLDLRRPGGVLGAMPAGERRSLAARIRKCGSSLAFRFFENDLSEAFETAVAIETASRKPERGISVFHDGQARRLFRSLLEVAPEAVGIGILSIRDEPAAHFLGFRYGRTFAMYHTAFTDRYARLGTGKMAAYFLLEHLRKSGFETADGLRGDTPAKRQFADRAVDQYDVYLSRSRVVVAWWKAASAAWRFLGLFKAFLERKRRSVPYRFGLHRNGRAGMMEKVRFRLRGRRSDQ